MRQLKFHLHATLLELSTCRLLMLLVVHKNIETFIQTFYGYTAIQEIILSLTIENFYEYIKRSTQNFLGFR